MVAVAVKVEVADTPVVGATLSVATSESWKDAQSGEWRERTEWHRVVIFNEGLMKVAEKHLEKGMKVRIEGKLRTRKWEDQSGQDRYSTEIHVENFDGSINFDMKRDPTSASGTVGELELKGEAGTLHAAWPQTAFALLALFH